MLEAFARSDGGDLTLVEVSFDGQPPQALCGGSSPLTCSNPLTGLRPVSGIAPGEHTLTIRAVDSYGCEVNPMRRIVIHESP